MSGALGGLETRLQYTFKQPDLLRQAVTHRSHSASHNERLEFLGDSVLNCAIADLLYRRFTTLNEGELSRQRANLVRQQTLFEVAQGIDVAACLRLGDGERKSGGKERPSILADTLEALVGAIFLDGGFDAARSVLAHLFDPIISRIDPLTLGKDAKTLLQEALQGRQSPLPQYVVVATHGAAHNQEFDVACHVPAFDIHVQGQGPSRRAAEQVAATLALEQLSTLVPAAAPRKRRPKNEPAVTQAPRTVRTAAGDAPPGPTKERNARSERR